MTFVGDFAWGMVDGKNAKTAAKDAGINAAFAAADGLAPGLGAQAYRAAKATKNIAGNARLGSKVAAVKNTARTAARDLAKKATNWRSLTQPRPKDARGIARLAKSTAKSSLKAEVKRQAKSFAKDQAGKALNKVLGAAGLPGLPRAEAGTPCCTESGTPRCT
ncbi:hypothetical protein HK405_003146 [Cladochytrium tenue]|nr:hypothetical protein HK405_003146 [Cladochytrium tenue]